MFSSPMVRSPTAQSQTPSSISYSALTQFRGEASASSSQCKTKLTEFLLQSSPSLPRNSVSCPFRNSTLETVLRTFPICKSSQQKKRIVPTNVVMIAKQMLHKVSYLACFSYKGHPLAATLQQTCSGQINRVGIFTYG